MDQVDYEPSDDDRAPEDNKQVPTDPTPTPTASKTSIPPPRLRSISPRSPHQPPPTITNSGRHTHASDCSDSKAQRARFDRVAALDRECKVATQHLKAMEAQRETAFKKLQSEDADVRLRLRADVGVL